MLTGAGKKAVTGVDLTVKKRVDKAFAKVKDVPGLAMLALDLENVAAATYLAAIDVVKIPAGHQDRGERSSRSSCSTRRS